MYNAFMELAYWSARVRKTSLFLRSAWLLLAAWIPLPATAQNLPLVHWINNAGQSAVAQLNSTGEFITNYKATNDVSVKLLAGSVNSAYQENFATTGSNNNPGYLTGFFGVSSNGTGNGVAAQMICLETALSSTAVTLQFDFAVPLTPQDRILLADADTGEQYVIEAFKNSQAISVSGWRSFSYSGQSTQLPDASWPVWNPATGTLTASTTGNLNEPLVVLAPDQTVDRVVLQKNPVGSGSLAIQFLTVPAPVLQIQRQNTNVILHWSSPFTNFSLYKVGALPAASTDWVSVTNAPFLNAGQWYITNSAPPTNTFYRLQMP
jgi:hypothetical protein